MQHSHLNSKTKLIIEIQHCKLLSSDALLFLYLTVVKTSIFYELRNSHVLFVICRGTFKYFI